MINATTSGHSAQALFVRWAMTRRSAQVMLGLVACAGLAATAARAQGDTPVDTGKSSKLEQTDAQLIDDFAHYVLTANYTMAESVAAQINDRGIDQIEFARMIDSGDVKRFEGAVSRALRVPNNAALQAAAARLEKAYRDGKLAQARSPEVVAANIALLSGPNANARGRLLATQGLIRAGEYAMPQLIDAFLQNQDPNLSVQVQSVMTQMGRPAIIPLATAMLKLPEALQEKIARVLGAIPYKMSLPFLADLSQSTRSEAVRAECSRAIQRLGENPSALAAASSYRALSEAYYAEKNEVTNFPGEDHQLLWAFDAQAGLAMIAIRTPVFHEAMSMRLSERAMHIEGAQGGVDADTIALWVSANYSREFDTPEGYINPAYPVEGAAEEGAKPRRGAEYFGVVSGPGVSQRVLARAIGDRDTPLARRALAAVEKTAGGQALLAPAAGRFPLGEALLYPNRRVQYDAALAIAAAQPISPFPGSERVVPTLASAVAGSTDQVALILAPDVERYQSMRALLERRGFRVLQQGASLSELDGAIAEVPSIDLVTITGYPADRLARSIEEVREGAKTAAAPILAMASADVYADQRRRYESDQTIAMRSIGSSEAALGQTIDDLVRQASGGPIEADEAAAYSARSLTALRDLAISGNQVLSVADAAGPLITQLSVAKGERLADVAEVLSRIPQDRTQRALADAALSVEGDDRLSLLNSLAASARRYGNALEDRQIKRLLELASEAGEQEATAASAALGALGVQAKDVVKLILSN